MTKIYRLFILAGVAAMLSACVPPATYRPEVSDDELRAEEEYQRQMVEEAARTGGKPRPWRKRKGSTKQFERVAERIEPAAAKLCQEMGLPEINRRCYYYFRTSNAPEINAYADGENVTLTSGMLRFLQDEDEIAFILGHELAHNMMGHLEAQRHNAIAGQLMGAVVDGLVYSQGGYANNDWQRAGAEIGNLSYSQSYEAEADYIGLYIAARAGYNIRKAPGLWRRWALEDPRGIYNATTHPSKPERFVAMKKAIEEIQYKRKHRQPLIPNLDGWIIEGDYEAKRDVWPN